MLSRVGDKWSLLVIGLLDDRSLRFTELQRRIDGISHRMLTQTLRNLERDGLVSRTSYAEIPPRVEYAATPLGRSLVAPVHELVDWASTHHEQITAARDAYDGTSALTDATRRRSREGEKRLEDEQLPEHEDRDHEERDDAADDRERLRRELGHAVADEERQREQEERDDPPERLVARPVVASERRPREELLRVRVAWRTRTPPTTARR